MTRSWSRGAWCLAAAVLLVLAGGCSRTSATRYSPQADLLSVAAEFELLAGIDPYRDGTPSDATGQNVARATLRRLANYSEQFPERFPAEVAMLRARALERLGDYDSAREQFLLAAEADTPMRDLCLQRAGIIAQLIAIRESGDAPASPSETVRFLESRAAAYYAFADASTDPTYRSLALVEAEQAEVARAEFLAANRLSLPDGEAQAIAALRGVAEAHRNSARALEHALRLARFHRSLAEEEARIHPPGGLRFDAARFNRHVDMALEVLFRVSQADGREERLVAARELDALLAYRSMILASAL